MSEEGKQMLPEVQALITARTEAEKVYSETLNKLRTERDAVVETTDDYYDDEAREARRDFNTKADEANESRMVALNTAWNDLGKSSDPLVRWIAEHCKEYQDYALDILKALPATLDELDAIAERKDWCHIWNRFREQAEEAGVLPDAPPPPSPARQAVYDWIGSYVHLSRSRRAGLAPLLDALVTEESKAA